MEKRLSARARKPFRKKIEPWLYLMPAIVFFVLFTYYPFFKTIFSSFFIVNRMGVIRRFAGFDNYARVLASRSFQTAIGNTMLYVLLAAPLSIIIALILAMIANKGRTISVVYETMYAIPMAMSMSVAAMIFKLAYNPNIGIINQMLGLRINWLNDKHYAMIAIGIISTWLNVGYNFLFLLAAVRNIPHEIMESCALDGANPVQRVMHIVLPLISPTLFFLICTSLAHSMMMSGLVLIFTNGAALSTTANIDTMISYMYKQAVNNLNYNDGYAVAIIAFLRTAVLMLISFRFEKKGVHYT
ncbi:MAG: sugar ABC transporter permease [Clostridia bacterium]|nr:sugar ABC transporter permease [Clostridia bacterium]